MNAIKNRYDFAYVFDVTSGNPNGDPDAGNAPRIDPETGNGFVTDVCLKRKIRNYITLAKGGSNSAPEPGYDIYVKEGSVLKASHQKAYEALGLKDSDKGGADKVRQARAWMCQNYFDIRMFGAVLSLKDYNCGQVRGPVQFAFARSIDPIVSLEQSITRMAVATEEEAKKQDERQAGQARTMGRKVIVPYGLYVAHGFVSPHLAADTGFTDEDLELLWNSLGGMFEIDRSAARGEMSARRLVVFRHESPLGNAPAHRLFERLKIERKDLSRPARAYSDYSVELDISGLPAGVTVEDKIV